MNITMFKKFRCYGSKFIAIAMLISGTILIVLSLFYSSTAFAIISIGLTFWGAILLYINPKSHVSLMILNAGIMSNLYNIEKILNDTKRTVKGVYLSPKYSGAEGSVLVTDDFHLTLPLPFETDSKMLHLENVGGLLLTPPGLALSKLFEDQLGYTFLKMDLSMLQEKLPDLLIDMGIVEKLEISTEDNVITIKLTNNLFSGICMATRKMEQVHKVLGCLLSSALACVLVRTTGKALIILGEELSSNGETTYRFEMLEEGTYDLINF